MKRLKFALLAVLFSAIGAMGFSSASAQTTYSLTYNPTGSALITFANGATSTAQTDKIKNTSNWQGSLVTPPSISCNSGANLCALEITVPAGQPTPAVSAIILQVHNWYRDPTKGNFNFVHGSPFTITISGVNYTVTIFLRTGA